MNCVINSYIPVLTFYFIISVLELQTTSETTELTKHSFTPLYVCIAVIILSGLLNVFLIVRLVQTWFFLDKPTIGYFSLRKIVQDKFFFRLLRISVCKQQKNQEYLNRHNEGITNESKHLTHSPKSGNKQGEDNSAYYELGDFSQESQYDKLPWSRNTNQSSRCKVLFFK